MYEETNKKIADKANKINNINNRIKKEICYNTINNLKDDALLSEYVKCISVKNKKEKYKSIFKKYNISLDKINLIINDREFILEAIQPGTKSVIRGNKFNNIVKNIINNLKLDESKFKICFEKNCDSFDTSEKPDWFILEKKQIK